MTGLVLTGKYEVKIDTMGRVVVPRDFRPQITQLCKDQLYVKPMSRYLIVFSPQTVERILMGNGNDFDEEMREARRDLGAKIVMVSMDNQGRIKIPDECRQVLGGSEQLFVIGMGEDFELWSQSRYSEFLGEEG